MAKTVDKQRDKKGRFVKGAGKWKKGESGNPKGRPKKEDTLISLLKESMAEKKVRTGKKKTRAQILCEKLFEEAEKGDMQAIKLIFEYVAGRPNQQQALTGLVTFRHVYDDD